MPERLSHLAIALGARPAHRAAGWRGAAAVDGAALAQRAAAWHAALQALRGRHYALYLDDSLEFAAALLGAWQAGKTVWLAADTLDATCAALAQTVDGFLGAFPARHAPLQPASDAAGAWAPVVLADDFPALVVFTSGSTGAAQPVPKSLAQLDSEVQVLEQMFGAALGDAAVIATVSHQHIYGLLFKVLWPLAAGRPLVAQSAVYPEQIAALLALRPALLVSSPAHVKRLPELQAWVQVRGNVRAVFSSGGPLPDTAAEGCHALLGQWPVEVYGSSETGGIAWRRRADGEGWRAFSNVQWQMDAEGLLAVQSPHLPDAGWHVLADRVQALPDGRFLLQGRADRIVKVEEKRIALDALEAVLCASPLVSEARVLPDPASGGRLRLAGLLVLSSEGQAALAAQGRLAFGRTLRALLAGVAEAVALPRRWRYLDRMPLNAQGKLTQAALLAVLAQDERPTQPVWRELARSAASMTLELVVPPDLLYFDGHFPEAPVLPGVVQLEWAIARACAGFALPPLFREVAALKFQQVIQPGAVVTLELQHDAVKHSVQFRYLSAAGQHASGRVLFGAP